MIKQLARVFVVALFAVSAVASTALAQDSQDSQDTQDAQRAPDTASVQVIDQPTVVRATQQRPAAFYVLPRSSRATPPTELRTSFVREVVRSARALR